MIRTQLFSSFINEYPNWETDAAVTQPNNSTYKSIPRSRYNNTLNVKTGEIFLGDERYVIFIKHVALLIFRPIQLTFKTLWHASLIGPLIVELHNFLNDKQTFEQFKENNLNSLCDIIRTPIYGVAMLTVHLAGIILGIFCPETLYYTRDLVGQLERELLRLDCVQNTVASLSPYESLSPCFSPISHLMIFRDVNKESLPIYVDINEFLENSDIFEPNSWDYSPQLNLKQVQPEQNLDPSLDDLIKNAVPR
ncbi:MAG: hypothetical protein H0T62_00930 [Parachlamydiaceae bacterium]|nr:hypothetical protein [Parachlamydiaceae bacterium]